MKKILYSFVAAALALVSCAPVEFNYEPANENVSFLSTSSTVSLTGQDIVIPVARGLAKEALSVGITLTDPSGVYTLETPVVNFAANQYEAEIVVSYDIKDMKPTVNYAFNVSFDKAIMSAVGNNSYSVSAMMPLEWEEYGEVTATKYPFGLSVIKNPVTKLYKAKYTTNYYKLTNLWDGTNAVEFSIKDGGCTIISPLGKCKYLSDPVYEIVTGTPYQNYGMVSMWLDPTPDYFYVKEGLGPDDSLIEGSVLYNEAFPTISAGHFSNYYTCELTVTKVN